jgi:hypothetical protein
VPVVAQAGVHTLDGALHYQACDHAACYPPKTLPVQVVFTAKSRVGEFCSERMTLLSRCVIFHSAVIEYL